MKVPLQSSCGCNKKDEMFNANQAEKRSTEITYHSIDKTIDDKNV